jgi:alpha-L-arabinofuranosidase
MPESGFYGKQRLSTDGGGRPLARTARVFTLAAAPDATNSLAAPAKVVPVASKLPVASPSFTCDLAPTSVTVLELKPR